MSPVKEENIWAASQERGSILLCAKNWNKAEKVCTRYVCIIYFLLG